MSIRLVALMLATATLATHPARAQTADCSEPNVLILFDVSGSMGRAAQSPPSKYDVAQNAIHTVTQSSEHEIRYGLMLFPEPGAYPVRCNVGTSLAVPVGLNNWQAIYNTISPTLYGSTTANPEFFGGPRGDFDTPMYQALDSARAQAALTDPDRRNYILLITDGVQDCCKGGDYDSEVDCDPTKSYTDPAYHIPAEYAENRQDLVELVTDIQDAGVTTFVVGFGSLVDSTTLNLLAQAGGTAPSGCGAGTNCYYQANNAAELAAALADITQVVHAEVCDGIDNNCDGSTDEGTALSCSTACGTGAELCQDGSYEACDAPQPQSEICDGVDNNCDGDTDEGCACMHGDTQTCGSDVGACATGTQTCSNGSWGPCAGAIAAGVELCDGRTDDDCDGEVDEGCECLPGNTRSCGTAVGQCETGEQTCTAQGQWGACLGGVTAASNDGCDGIDNDCDGETDEYCGCTHGETRSCGSSVGACESGIQSCYNGVWLDCAGESVGGAEACNLVDDDCDGDIDEGAACASATCICGVCAAPCDNTGGCPGGGVCLRGFCIVTDLCPDGFVCDGEQCVADQPTDPGTGGGNTDGGGDYGDKEIPAGVDSGCDCKSGGALSSGYGLLFVALAFVQRIHRRRHQGR